MKKQRKSGSREPGAIAVCGVLDTTGGSKFRIMLERRRGASRREWSLEAVALDKGIKLTVGCRVLADAGRKEEEVQLMDIRIISQDIFRILKGPNTVVSCPPGIAVAEAGDGCAGFRAQVLLRSGAYIRLTRIKKGNG